MTGALGHAAVLLGFLAAVAGIALVGTGLVRHKAQLLKQAGIYAGLMLFAAVVAVAVMEHALITHDFRLAFVAANNSRETPLFYSITGLWSALAGSILLWALVLSGYIAAMVWHFRHRATDPLVGWATLTCFVVAAFFFALILGPANPFKEVVGAIPPDGAGPNALLQDNLLVVIHPPFLYLGFVGFTIPFSFAIGALATGRLGESWLAETRRWTLFAWGLLTVGIILGAWWSYKVLGWGGFWAWDPVENAAFLPWLTGTAYLHSVMAQERRGLLRVWNISLVVATFSLTILGTFLTRSGVLESVHSFSESNLGPVLIGFFGVVTVVSVGLIWWRGDLLRARTRVEHPLSREGGFLVNNLLFAAFAFVVLLGTVFPLFAAALNGSSLTVGRPYFDTMTTPIGLALLFFMAVGPVLSWRRSSGSAVRSRLVLPAWAGGLTILGCALAGIRGIVPLLAFGLGAFAGVSALAHLYGSVRSSVRSGATGRSGVTGFWRGLVGRSNGGMVVHLGVVVIGVALAASMSFGRRSQVTLFPGRSTVADGQTLTYRGVHTVVTPSRTEEVADVEVVGRGVMRPGVSQFGTDLQAVGTPAISAGLRNDVYITFDGPPTGESQSVLIGVIVQPMVSWLWIGGGIMALGTLLAGFPRRRRSEAAAVAGSAVAVAGAAVALSDRARSGLPAPVPVITYREMPPPSPVP
ncbi:MAG: heme lyase CcmF/NrfE family subunit [Acidimicrobiales bacterium]